MVSCASSLRTQEPITPGVRGFKDCVATWCSNRKSSAYGSLRSQGRRKRVQTFRQPQNTASTKHSFHKTQLPQNTASRSRRAIRARFAMKVLPLKFRGRRECRAPSAPRSRVCSVESTRVSHHGYTGITRHSPRNGFTAYFRALPGDRALLPPSPAEIIPPA
jgi:hypothetical protein